MIILSDSTFDGRRLLQDPVAITIDGGVIARVEPLERVDPAQAGVFDARGALVMPGLVDVHVHIARGGVFEPHERISPGQTRHNLRATLAAGVTTIGDMACAAPLIARLRSLAHADAAAGPSIRAAGPILTAPRGYPLDWMPPLFVKLGLALPCATERDAKAAVARVAAAGMDHVKLAIMHQSYAEAPLAAISEPVARAAVSEARRLGLRALAHAHSVADYRVALAAGVDALMHSSFEPLDAELALRVRDAGVTVCPTLWVFESVCLGAELRFDRDPRYTAHVAPYIRRGWTRFVDAFEASGDVVPPGIAGGLPKARMTEAIRTAAANLRLLRDAGVPIAFGNDASYGFSLVARPVDELAAMQRAGMDAPACLRAATADAAALLGLDDRGVLEAGKRADVIVVDARAKTDVAALESPRAVFARGRRVDGAPTRAGRFYAAFARGLVETASQVVRGSARRG